MKAFDGYEARVSSPAVDRLPVGNYIVRLIDAEELKYSWGSVLAIRFDIADGDYADYYSNRYASRRADSKEKYKGVFRLNIPTGDGSDKDKWTIHKFNNAMGCLEHDNPGFKWKWDEKKLSGLKCGMVFREREWAFDGNTGFYTEPYTLTTIESIENGTAKTPNPKLLTVEEKRANGVVISITADDTFSVVNEDQGDLPF